MQTLNCPLPINEKDVITMAHGSGGKHTAHLLEKVILPHFSNPALNHLHDGALLDLPLPKVVFTTDSYVIWPLFFPGGDIGKLAVIGTLNDLAMCGAKPAYISCSLILEEGLPYSDLQRIVASMHETAKNQGISIVTGDTKVVERGHGHSLFINTSGIGSPLTSEPILPSKIREGDAIILSGDIGRHGMAIMAKRQGFTFSTPLETDCAPLFPLVKELIDAHIPLHCLRDLTRGGLATALVELSESSNLTFYIDHTSIPVTQAVHSACEILGFDPLYVANEGRFIAFVPMDEAKRACSLLHPFQDGKEACIIGTVQSQQRGVHLKNNLGVTRPLTRLTGDQLPRIC